MGIIALPFSNFPSGGDKDILTLMLMMFVSLWACVANYAGRLRRGLIKRFSMKEFLLDLCTCSFASLLVGMLCLYFKVNIYLLIVMVGLAGHSASRTLFLLTGAYENRLRFWINKIDKK